MLPTKALFAAFTIVAATLLAGCVSVPQDSQDDEPAPEPAFAVAALPEVDIAHFMETYQPFVETYNTRKGNHEDHLGARDALATMFAESGLEVVRQEFEAGIAQENIIGIKWGVDRTNWVVVGAHYDTTTTGSTHDEQSQGAYDDGSGTMMVQELARAFSNITPYYTIAFVEFDGEERGLQGSRAFYQAVNDNDFVYKDIEFQAMLDLDMFGLNWPICAPIYFDQNNAALRDLVLAYALDEMGIPEDMIKPVGITLGQSDYAHWYGTETPTAFFIADFEELAAPGIGGSTPAGCLPPVPGAYPFWHNADNWETMVQMAGGEENLRAGMKTALDLSAYTLWVMSADPDVKL